MAGVISGATWFAATEVLRREGWVEWGLETWVARIGRWRDLVIEEDLAEAGWRVWEERRGEKLVQRLVQREGKRVMNGAVRKKKR